VLAESGQQPTKHIQKYILRNRILWLEFEETPAALYAVKKLSAHKAEEQVCPLPSTALILSVWQLTVRDVQKLVVPEEIPTIIDKYHKEVSSHSGVEGTFQRVSLLPPLPTSCGELSDPR